MNKADLANKIAERLQVSKKKGEEFVDLFVELVTNTLKAGEEATIAGFGTFSAKKRSGRAGVDPRNPSLRIQMPEVIVPKFKAGKFLKDSLKGKR